MFENFKKSPSKFMAMAFVFLFYAGTGAQAPAYAGPLSDQPIKVPCPPNCPTIIEKFSIRTSGGMCRPCALNPTVIRWRRGDFDFPEDVLRNLDQIGAYLKDNPGESVSFILSADGAGSVTDRQTKSFSKRIAGIVSQAGASPLQVKVEVPLSTKPKTPIYDKPIRDLAVPKDANSALMQEKAKVGR